MGTEYSGKFKKKVVAIYKSAQYKILILKNVSMSVLIFSNYVTLSLFFNIACNLG